MHILVLNFEYPPLGGGASPVCHEINKRYVESGHKVTVVTMIHTGLKPFEITDGVEVYRVSSLRNFIHMSYPHEQLSYLFKTKALLKKLIASKSFDVCHAHFLLPTGILCLWLKRKYGIPSIITSHGSDVPGFNPDRFKFLHLMTPPLIRAIARSASFITSPSCYLAELISKVIRQNPETLQIVPNGIDPAAYYSGAKKNMIVSSGRFLRRKGFHSLILAVRNISIPVELHILGDGPIRSELEKLAEGSATPIIFHGWVDNRSGAYKELLASASVYCLVSSHENASVAILEAMASGCAVITSDQSGCPEMIADAGIKVPFGKPEEITKAILSVMNNNDLRNSLSQKAIQRAQDVYDWNRIKDQYLHLMSKAIHPGQA